MASLIVNQGLQRLGDTISQTSGYSSSRYVRTMAFDDSSSALAAGTTTLGSPTNVVDQAFDSTPTRSAQTVSHVTTLATGAGNFTIRRITLHDDTAANVTGSSSTLFGGVDGQSLTKTSDFTLEATLSLAYTSV